MLEQGEILNLSNDKEYVVVSSVEYEGNNYVYIIDTDTYKDYRLCKYEDETLKEVKDAELLKVLITKFNTDLKEHLTEIISENQ